jgi:hypothetical protein
VSDRSFPPSDNKEAFGSCTYASMAPAQLATDTKALNFVLSFEEALKLNIAISAAVHALTRKNRGTPHQRRAGVKLILHLKDKQRIRVQPG